MKLGMEDVDILDKLFGTQPLQWRWRSFIRSSGIKIHLSDQDVEDRFMGGSA